MDTSETGQLAQVNKSFKSLFSRIPNNKKEIVILQNFCKKLVNAEWTKKFNETCLKKISFRNMP